MMTVHWPSFHITDIKIILRVCGVLLITLITYSFIKMISLSLILNIKMFVFCFCVISKYLYTQESVKISSKVALNRLIVKELSMCSFQCYFIVVVMVCSNYYIFLIIEMYFCCCVNVSISINLPFNNAYNNTFINAPYVIFVFLRDKKWQASYAI